MSRRRRVVYEKEEKRPWWHYALAGLIIWCLLGYVGVLPAPWEVFQISPHKPTSPQPPTGQKPYPVGIMTMDVAAYDSLDITQTRTIGTDVKVVWYAYRGGWVQLKAGDDVDVNVLEEDQGKLYAMVYVPPGKNYYVDRQKILEMNKNYVTGYQYIDITGDRQKEWIFTLDVSKAPYASGTGKYIAPTLNVYLVTYDDSFGFPSGGRPADITGVGTTAITKTIDWYTTISAEKKGIAIYKVTLTVNTSDVTKVSLVSMQIPGLGAVDGSAFTRDEFTNQIRWTYVIGNDLDTAQLLTRPAGAVSRLYFTTTLELNLDSGDTIAATLTIYQFEPDGDSITDSDTVNISAS